MRRLAVVTAVHAALIAAIWLAASVVYASVFASPQPLWIAVDVAIVAACAWLVRRRASELGFASLGEHKARRIAIVVGFALACALASQLVVGDANGVWIDESNYLATLRAGHIVRDGLYPFNVRWLEPILAGRLNILPVDDAEALKAMNFGALVVTGVLLTLLLVRLRVRFALALVAPVFLLASYLGVYAATNRLVLDPFNYAMFVVLLHALLRRQHWPLFGAALFVTALGSEKAVYWVPVFAALAFVESKRSVLESAKLTLRYCGSALVYLVAIRLYVWGAQTDAHSYVRNVHLMALTPLGAKVSIDPAVTTSQMLWFPFGAFTIYALLGFAFCERRLKPIALLVVPILLSTLVAVDTQRMVAYAFVVYLPLGYLYLVRVVDDLPRPFGLLVLGALVALAVAQHYLLPVLDHVVTISHPNIVKLALSSIELVLVGSLLFLHLGFYRSTK